MTMLRRALNLVESVLLAADYADVATDHGRRPNLIVRGLVRISAWALLAVIIAASLVPPTLRPETDLPHVIEHFAVFFATGTAFALGYAARHELMAMALVLFCAAIELAQLFISGRHARLSDFVVDAAAAALGISLTSLLQRYVRQLPT